MRRKEFLASLGVLCLTPMKWGERKARLFGSGFWYKNGVELGFHMDNCEYDMFVSLQKREKRTDNKDPIILELEKRLRALREAHQLDIDNPQFDHDEVLDTWVERLSARKKARKWR